MDTVFRVRLHSYGFLHPGRERLRTVLKRSWPFIPGSTLYGAVAAALIRLDGMGAGPPGEGAGGYHHLLRLVSGGGSQSRIRFTPLLPVADGQALESARDYCQQVQALDAPARQSFFFTTPHAPLARDTLRIHGDQLYAFSNHRAGQGYAGFVFAPAEWGDDLRRALRLLPIQPLGGKGKFSLVEGEVTNQEDLGRFRAEFKTSLVSSETVRLLTPMILQNGQSNWLMEEATAVTDLPRLRRYRSWRTGAYYDFLRGEFDLGLEADELVDENRYGAPGGAESKAATGVPEDTRFVLADGEELTAQIVEHFIQGVGHPNWTYLGWGQVVVE